VVPRVKVDCVFPALPRCLDIYPSSDLLPLLVLELQHYYTSSIVTFNRQQSIGLT
jgi:hypothetical protein